MLDKILRVKFSHSNRNRCDRGFCIRTKKFPRQIFLIFKTVTWNCLGLKVTSALYIAILICYLNHTFLFPKINILYFLYLAQVCAWVKTTCVCRTFDYLLGDTLGFFFLLFGCFFRCVLHRWLFFGQFCMLTRQPSLLARKRTQIGYLA